MKTAASILMTFDPGNSIEDAFHDAVEVASKIGCVIEFKFNEVNYLKEVHYVRHYSKIRKRGNGVCLRCR